MREHWVRRHRRCNRDACMQSARHAFLLLFGLLWADAACRAAAEATIETVHPVSGNLGPTQEHAPAQRLLQQPAHVAGQHGTMAAQAADQSTGAAGASSSQDASSHAATAAGTAVPPEHALKGGSSMRQWIVQKLEGLQQTLESVPGLAPEPAIATKPQDTAAVFPGTAAATSQQGPASYEEQDADAHARQHVQQQQQQQQQVTQQNFQQALATAVQQAEQAAEPQTLAAFNVRCTYPCTLLCLLRLQALIQQSVSTNGVPPHTSSMTSPMCSGVPRIGFQKRDTLTCPEVHRPLGPQSGTSAR